MLENYARDDFGVIHQIDASPKVYDAEYLSYYEGLRDRTIKLGYQRLGWVLGETGMLDSVLEIGYGLGTFLEAAQLAGVPDCAGCDVARYPLPEGCEFVTWEEALERKWEHVAMFDVLEHISDLSFLGKLKTETLSLSVPWCQWFDKAFASGEQAADDWFRDWRMRLPDEHLHHFDEVSLQALLRHHGFHGVDLNTYEDGLRLRDGETGPNILCGFFESK